jgi:hypothetical protein
MDRWGARSAGAAVLLLGAGLGAVLTSPVGVAAGVRGLGLQGLTDHRLCRREPVGAGRTAAQ